MTDEAQKPKRKRWRWIVAGVLLFVAAVGWWYWPRGDVRFVGKWEVISLHKDGSQHEGRIVLHFNGTADGMFSAIWPRSWQTASPQGDAESLSLGNLYVSLPWGLAQETVFSVHSVEHDMINLGLNPEDDPVLALIRTAD